MGWPVYRPAPMDRLGGKGGYLPLILPLASAVGFCLSRYRRWDTRFCRLCILCRCSLLYSFFFLALGMSISFVARSRHLKSVPALSRTIGSSITSYPSAVSNLHSSACCSFFSMTLSMYLVSEEYPNSISHKFSWVCHLSGLEPYCLHFESFSSEPCQSRHA
jgi:hypothetical protein